MNYIVLKSTSRFCKIISLSFLFLTRPLRKNRKDSTKYRKGWCIYFKLFERIICCKRAPKSVSNYRNAIKTSDSDVLWIIRYITEKSNQICNIKVGNLSTTLLLQGFRNHGNIWSQLWNRTKKKCVIWQKGF